MEKNKVLIHLPSCGHTYGIHLFGREDLVTMMRRFFFLSSQSKELMGFLQCFDLNGDDSYCYIETFAGFDNQSLLIDYAIKAASFLGVEASV